MTTTRTISATAEVNQYQYHGVARLPDGKWFSTIVNREGNSYTIGAGFRTAEEAALTHDRTILAILGPEASAEVLNFRAAFSDTELRFLRGHHSPARCVRGVVDMLRTGNYDAELARFAEHAFENYMDPELAQDVTSFRLTQGDTLRRHKEEVVAATGVNLIPVAHAKAERDVEREAFLEAAKNKATNVAWVESYCRRCQQSGLAFEDDNRWPLMVPSADINFGDWRPAEELIYLPHRSSYVNEMMAGNGLAEKGHHV